MNAVHKTPLGPGAVATELEYGVIVHGINHRFALFGVDPRCADCPEKCAQAGNPHFSTCWECFRNPGPLFNQYQRKRRFAGPIVAEVFGSTEAGAVPRAVPTTATFSEQEKENDIR